MGKSDGTITTSLSGTPKLRVKGLPKEHEKGPNVFYLRIHIQCSNPRQKLSFTFKLSLGLKTTPSMGFTDVLRYMLFLPRGLLYQDYEPNVECYF